MGTLLWQYGLAWLPRAVCVACLRLLAVPPLAGTCGDNSLFRRGRTVRLLVPPSEICRSATERSVRPCSQSLVAGEEFQHILRVLNTNVDGKQKVMYAMTAIRGIGRRFSNLVCKKAEVDMTKRWVSIAAI